MKKKIATSLTRLGIILFSLLFLGTESSGQQKTTAPLFGDPAVAKKYLALITPDELSKKLYVIASDSFGGRGTGEIGQKMAAEYIASFYKSLGLSPKGTLQKKNTAILTNYLQPFKLYEGAPKEAKLELRIKGKPSVTSSFSNYMADDLSYYLSGGAMDAIGSVIFAGYGIADDTLGYNDYAALKAKGISIKDKWIMVIASEPSVVGSTSLLNTPGHQLSAWSQGSAAKRMALWRTGEIPKGILIVTDQDAAKKTSFEEDARAATLLTRAQQQLFLIDPSGGLPQAYAVSSRFANLIIESSGRRIEDIKSEIDKNLKPTVFEIKDASIRSSVKKKKNVGTENVLAFLEGTDPQLKNEIIVISAHYDHLGIDKTLSGDQIFNGAADDGSGTVAVLQMAKAFKKAKDEGNGPRRSILFANFTGEERGLLGSEYFTSVEPVVPLNRIVAEINMDGVGGIDSKHPTKSKNYVYISGQKGFSDSLIAINLKAKDVIGSLVELTDAPPGFSSDHESFRDYHIPYLYYSSGKTDHYHQVSDEANTIDYVHMANVSQLIFATAWQVANQTNSIRNFKVKLKQAGFICRPCGHACDQEVFKKMTICPYCRMHTVPRFVEE